MSLGVHVVFYFLYTFKNTYNLQSTIYNVKSTTSSPPLDFSTVFWVALLFPLFADFPLFFDFFFVVDVFPAFPAPPPKKPRISNVPFALAPNLASLNRRRNALVSFWWQVVHNVRMFSIVHSPPPSATGNTWSACQNIPSLGDCNK